MKSAVESLNPTRVRLTVEVPFDELKPDLDTAYREIGRQVRISGFRPGKVPARILDQRVGRGAVLEQAMQGAVPRLYGDALRANEVQVVGQPDVEVTKFADGEELIFTADVDVRPEIELPDYRGLAVTVDDAEVAEEDIDEQLGALRERFATLTSVQRPVAAGDYVLLDLVATIDGEEVSGSQATGLSYEVGSNDLMPGLDEAITGAAEGETRTFDSDLTRGDYAERIAQVGATVRSVKEKDLPTFDDDFAQTASEFDTIEEMRADARARMGSMKRIEQGVQARDRVLEALLERVEVPLPESLIKAEIEWRQENINSQLAQAGLTMAEYLAAEDRTEEDMAAEIAESAREAVKSQFVLEAVAGKEEVGVSEAELTDHIVRRGRQLNLAPDVFARQVVDSGGLGTLASEVVRGKALALILEQAVITDVSGRPVDLNAVSTEYEAAADGDELAQSERASAPLDGEPVAAGPEGEPDPAVDGEAIPAAGDLSVS
ncbi:MAG: trigger factor [Frankiaceae bacterium]